MSHWIHVSALIVLCFGPALSQRTFYVRNGGNDRLDGQSDGNAWATIAKVNATSFAPGDRILFKRGSTWRESLVISSSGASDNPITFGAYGSGPKPLLLGSTDMSLPDNWVLDAGNVWKSNFPINAVGGHAPDVGNLIFDNEAGTGFKKFTRTDLKSQGDFWYSPADHLVYIYSASNPGAYYQHIEAARTPGWPDGIVGISGKSYVTVENLDLRYGGTHGLALTDSPTNIVTQGCDFSWIGGCFLNSTERYGNGWQVWDGCADLVVQYCTFNQIYDTGVTPQGTDAPYRMARIHFFYNVFQNCNESFEFWCRDATSSADDIRFENNTCVGAGKGWSQAQRPDNASAAHISFHETPGTLTNIIVRNNIFDGSVTSCVYFDNWGSSQLAATTLDYNCYWQPSGRMINYNWTYYTQAQFSSYQSARSKDLHSIVANPGFVSSVDFHLLPESPAIDSGEDQGLTGDCEGNPINGRPDLGAFESSPRVPVLLMPSVGSSGIPLSFISRWRRTAAARVYQIQVADNEQFAHPILDDSTTVDTLHQVDIPTADILYYCRVRAKGPSTWGEYCGNRVFVAGDDSKTGVRQLEKGVPLEFALSQNFPNPFNPTTVIRFALPTAARVELKVYDTIGREVARLVDELKSAGVYYVTFDATRLASGVYFCRILATPVEGRQSQEFTAVKKLLVVK